MVSDRERWNDRWGETTPSDLPSPPGVLLEFADLLPTSGRAIDLAGGAGDGALWLAQRGYEATLADVSDVALAQAQARARSLGLTLATECVDLEANPAPAGPWELIVVAHYLNRSLLRQLPHLLSDDGVLVVGIGTERNLERHPRPSARFLLRHGELPDLVPDLTTIEHREDWAEWGVHEARYLGRRTAGAIN